MNLQNHSRPVLATALKIGDELRASSGAAVTVDKMPSAPFRVVSCAVAPRRDGDLWRSEAFLLSELRTASGSSVVAPSQSAHALPAPRFAAAVQVTVTAEQQTAMDELKAMRAAAITKGWNPLATISGPTAKAGPAGHFAGGSKSAPGADVATTREAFKARRHAATLRAKSLALAILQKQVSAKAVGRPISPPEALALVLADEKKAR